MGRYYDFDKDNYYNIREEESIYGAFSDNEPKHVQRALRRTALHQAVSNSDFDEAKHLLKKGEVDINQQDSHGNTALHLAVSNQESFPKIYSEIIELLASNGARSDIKNQYGDTPKSLAESDPATRIKLALMYDLPPMHEKPRQ